MVSGGSGGRKSLEGRQYANDQALAEKAASAPGNPCIEHDHGRPRCAVRTPAVSPSAQMAVRPAAGHRRTAQSDRRLVDVAHHPRLVSPVLEDRASSQSVASRPLWPGPKGRVEIESKRATKELQVMHSKTLTLTYY